MNQIFMRRSTSGTKPVAKSSSVVSTTIKLLIKHQLLKKAFKFHQHCQAGLNPKLGMLNLTIKPAAYSVV